MHPLLVLAVAAGLAALMWNRYRRKPALVGAMPSQLEATIVLGGTPAEPTVQVCPDPLCAAPGEDIRWTIQDPQNTEAEVWLTGFKPKGSNTKNDPLVGPERNRMHKKTIVDRVSPAARKGLYDYEIWLNGKMAADPDILIKDI